VFVSYSHKDSEIVRQFERYAVALGDRYLLDCNDLQRRYSRIERAPPWQRHVSYMSLQWQRQ
jgi:hypothetical protein